jgi:hypothetical protein
MSKFQPYTYLIGWTKHNRWYYGVRTANKTTPHQDLWKVYFTSSRYVKDFRNTYGEPDIIQIRKIFEGASVAMKWESMVLKRLNAKNEEKWINMIDHYPNYESYKRNGNYYCNNGSIERRIPKGLPIPDTFIKGRLPGRVPDPGHNSVTVKDKLGNIFRINKSDPIYISGEVVMINKGKVHDAETRKTFATKNMYECQHCNKLFNAGNIKLHTRSIGKPKTSYYIKKSQRTP